MPAAHARDQRLQTIDAGRGSLDAYAEVAGAAAISEIRELAEPLRGRRVLYLNGAGCGPGVAEQLRALVPLLCDAGLEAQWGVTFGDDDFVAVARALHDGVQGGEWAVDDAAWRSYLECSEAVAASLSSADFDAIVVHDPQAAPLIDFARRDGADWIWRCHLDASEPDPEAWSLIAPCVARFDARVFSMPEFVPAGLPGAGMHVTPPAIDPLSAKNVELPWEAAGAVLRSIGIDLERPLVCHLSRFDAWGDPLGVIEAWRLAKQRIGELQLAVVGWLDPDDVEGWRLYREIDDFGSGMEGLFVFTNYSGIGGVEVNALERIARCVIQRSIREGFGLVASEALFKATPVVAGDAAGIRAQIRDGRDGYLVAGEVDCAERIVELVRDPGLALALGRSGREHVRSRFLITRLLADELRLLARPAPGPAAANEEAR